LNLKQRWGREGRQMIIENKWSRKTEKGRKRDK
jgi:hypothetical protein